MRKRRLANLLTALLLAGVPTALGVTACSKPEPPPPGPLASDEDNKPKKKKKSSTDDEDPKPIGDPTDPSSGGGDAAAPKIVGPTGDAGKSKSDSDKAKLMACCTALRNAATAAGIAGAAGSAVIPGLPPPPPKAELDKQVVECDKQVANWSGDLNASMTKVKGASPVALPSACALSS